MKPHHSVVYLLLSWQCYGVMYYTVYRICCTHMYCIIIITVLFYSMALEIKWTALTRSLPDGLAKFSIITVAIHKRASSTNYTVLSITCIYGLRSPCMTKQWTNSAHGHNTSQLTVTGPVHMHTYVHQSSLYMYNIVHVWSTVITPIVYVL